MAISDLLAQISGDTSTTKEALPCTQAVIPKRKADTELPRTIGKHVKTEQHTANSSRPIAQTQHLGNSTKITREEPSKVGGRSYADATRNGAAKTTAAPPKKGSHAEIMARAKAGQMAFGQVGKIQHKPIEKGSSKVAGRAGLVSRSGRAAGGSSWSKGSKLGLANVKNENAGQQGDKGGYGGTAKDGNRTKGTTSKSTRLGMDEPVKKIKKAATATTGYTGTARPNPTLTKAKSTGSMNSSAAPLRGPPKRGDTRRYSRYEDEEEEDDDDEEDYESDISSDMEAATFEVDEEEERALRIAKQEDIEEERRLKREAEEKRKRLTALRGGR